MQVGWEQLGRLGGFGRSWGVPLWAQLSPVFPGTVQSSPVTVSPSGSPGGSQYDSDSDMAFSVNRSSSASESSLGKDRQPSAPGGMSPLLPGQQKEREENTVLERFSWPEEGLHAGFISTSRSRAVTVPYAGHC